MSNVEDLLQPCSTIERSLKNSCRQNHLILGWVVICIHGRRGHAPPTKNKEQESHHERLTSRSQQIQNIDTARAALSGWLQISLEGMGTLICPLPPRLIRDKDQFSGEKVGCLGTFVDGSSILLSQYNGNVSPSERATSSLASRAMGMRVAGSNSLVSVGSFPQLVRSHSGWEVVVLHDILEVKLGHHLKLKETGIRGDRKMRYYLANKGGRMVRTYNTVPHIPTSLNTLSSFVEFMMNSGYPTMLYIASACDK